MGNIGREGNWTDYGVKAVLVAVLILFHIPYFGFSTFSNSDEFTSLAVPAFLAGKDWGSVAKLSGFHGYGMTILLTPVFKLTENSVVLYQSVIALALLLKTGSMMVYYSILHRHLKLPTFVSAVTGLCCVMGPLAADDSCSLSAMGEIPLGFLFILLLYLIILIQKSKRKELKKIFFLSFSSGAVSAYGYTIHSRCLIIFVGLIVAFGVYKIVYKRNMVNPFGFLLGFAVVFFLAWLMTAFIKNNIYSISKGEKLANDTGAVLMSSSYLIKKLWNPEQLKQCLFLFLSLFSTVFLVSGGFICFGTGIGIFEILGGIRRGQASLLEERIVFLVAFLGLMCFLGMNFTMALTATGHIENGDYRWLTYIRYAKPFLGPVLIIGIYGVYKRKNGSIDWMVLALAVGSVFFINGYLSETLSGSYGLNYSILNRIFYDSDKISVPDYLAVFSKVCLYLTILFLILKGRKKGELFVLLIFLQSSLVFFKQTEFYIGYNERMVNNTDTSVKLLNEGQLLERITVVSDAQRVTYSMYLQFALLNDRLECGTITDIENKENILFLTDREIGKGESGSIYGWKLDEKEYAYTWDGQIAGQIENWLKTSE